MEKDGIYANEIERGGGFMPIELPETVNRHILTRVVQEQKNELTHLMSQEFCLRREESQVSLKSPLAQVVMGVRRSGKSTLCINVLKKTQLRSAYVNFDDERLECLQTQQLDSLLEILYQEYGDFEVLFLDEIQNVDGWYLFVNRLLRQGLKLLITGSNAKLLSGELATHLTGRYEKIELFPFSFSEYCRCLKINQDSVTAKSTGFRRKAYENYLKQGGFPELLSLPDSRLYVQNLVASILKRDIEKRHRIRNGRCFEQLAHHLMNISPAVVSESDLAAQFGLSHTTVGQYIDYLKEAYLLVGLRNYSTKSIQRVRNEKVYVSDVALMNGREGALAGANLGWRLETQVYIELLRRNRPQLRDVYYYRNKSGVEADFLVCQGRSVQEIYQVSYDVSHEKTFRREVQGLLSASQETHCDNLFLLTDSDFRTLETNGKKINVYPFQEWLASSILRV